MLEIWGRNNSVNVQKVLWSCDELGVSFHRYDVGGPFGGNREPEYLARNPTGLIPTISDNGFALWESNTIVRYLSAKHGAGSLWPENPEARSRRQMDGLPARHDLARIQNGLPRSDQDTTRGERPGRNKSFARKYR